MKFEKLGKVPQISEFLTRVVIGLIFIMAGYGKLFASPGIDGFTGMLTGLSVPLPAFFAVLVGIIELTGGIMLLLGAWTTIPAALLSFIIFVAISIFHINNGWGDVRYPLLLMVATLRYVGTPGYLSVCDLLKKK